MASDHVLALSHIAVFGAGLMTIALLSRGLAHTKRSRVRSDDIPRRARPLRLILRRGIRILRSVVRLVARLGLALATPVGLLAANRRYPLVAPVLAPFEKQLATLGHRSAPACCFPLLVRRVWLVRCAGCQRRVYLLEVPSLDGTAVDLKVMSTSAWGARPCAVEYLTAQPSQVADTIRPVRIVRPVQQRTLPVPAARAVQLNTSWSLAIDIGMRNIIEIYGSAGTLIAELTAPAPAVHVYTEGETSAPLAGWITPHIKPTANEPHDYQSWPTNALHYRREVEDVVRRFRQGLPFRAGLEDGVQACRIIAAGYESARRGAEIRLASLSESAVA